MIFFTMDAKSLIARFGALKNKQTKWFRVWSDCARYCLPNDSPLRLITGKTTAGQSKQQPLDVSGIGAATKLASWLYSSTVYQGEEWFSLKARRIDGEDEHDFEIEEWLQRASAAVLDTINPSNFIQVYQKMLRGYVVFGTTVLYSEFNDKKELVCKSWDISDGIYIGEDKNGEIDTVFREFEYSARQAAQAFGLENLHAEIQRVANDPAQQDRKFKFIHCVFPRTDADKTKKLPKYKQFASVYVDIANEKIVEEGGTDTFPYCVPRFYNTGEVYGRSYVGISFEYFGELIPVAAVQLHERKRPAGNLLYASQHIGRRVGEVVNTDDFIAGVDQFHRSVGAYVSGRPCDKYPAFAHFLKNLSANILIFPNFGGYFNSLSLC